MSERPIIFSGPMVRAILDGRKTQTRRVLRCLEPNDVLRESPFVPSGIETTHGRPVRVPFAPGDLLWARETHFIQRAHGQHRTDGVRWGSWSGLPMTVSPDGTEVAYYREGFDRSDPHRWSPPIHMPRWASRITLRVTDVRVQRLLHISGGDAVAEGMVSHGPNRPQDDFAQLWNSLNAKRGYPWESNPWVAAISFERGTP
jgi:hypothetical protein